MKSTPYPPLLNELKVAMEFYEKNKTKRKWDYSSFLQPGEIKVIRSYLRTGSYLISGKKLGIEPGILMLTIKDAITKLNLFRDLNGSK